MFKSIVVGTNGTETADIALTPGDRAGSAHRRDAARGQRVRAGAGAT